MYMRDREPILPPLFVRFAANMSTTQEVRTCGICKQTKMVENFNHIPHSPSELQKNCCQCNSHKSSNRKKGRHQGRVSDFLGRLTSLSQFLSTLAEPDGAEDLVFHHGCPPETTIIEAEVPLPPMDFSPLPEQHISPILVEALNTCDLECYFCSYMKYLAGVISEKMSYRWWYAKSQIKDRIKSTKWTTHQLTLTVTMHIRPDKELVETSTSINSTVCNSCLPRRTTKSITTLKSNVTLDVWTPLLVKGGSPLISRILMQILMLPSGLSTK